MKKYVFLIFMVFFVLFTVSGVYGTERLVTGREDQKSVEVTVYNRNVGLVKDIRTIRLRKGLQELNFMDVASQIIPTSVSIQSLSSSRGLDVLEQNYEYDLLNPRKLIDKYVGKTVKLYQKNYYTEREEVVSATILSNNDGVPVFRIGNEITFSHPGRIIFPEIPENLISKPTLVWLLRGNTDAPQKIQALYLTNGINWKADYVLLLNKDDTAGNLNGWVTITNKSGGEYRDAKLKLVAGDVHRAEDNMRKDRLFALAETRAKAAPSFKEEAFFEYHIYTLERKTTIKENQTKQISLIESEGVPVKKELACRGNAMFYRNKYGDRITQEKVGVFIEIVNKKEGNLGIPLPKGLVRVYKYDNEKSLQFIGEDSIDHTPKDEKIKIKLGNAFDVAVTRKQTHWEKLAVDTYEVGFEISIRNHKKEDVVVRVIEPMGGDWKILESSLPFKKEDAFTVAYSVPVKKDKETKLTYKARIRY